MPRMNILNAVEQEAFESAPVFNSFQRKQYFDFPQAIQQATANLRTPANQLCFLLSCLLQSEQALLFGADLSSAGC